MNMQTRYPTIASSFPDDIDGQWVDPVKALTDDPNNTTSALLETANASSELRLSGFRFAIPEDHTIDSLEIAVDRLCDDSHIVDRSVYILLDGQQVGEAQAKLDPWEESLETVTYEITSDQLTPRAINAGIEVRIGVRLDDGSSPDTASINYVSLTANLTPPVVVPDPTPDTPEIAAGVAYVSMHAQATSDPVLTVAELIDLVESVRVVDSEDRVITDPAWVPTFLLDRAVADAWRLKAAKSAGAYEMSHTGFTMKRNQVNEMCLKMAKIWDAKDIGTMTIASTALEQGMRDWSSYTIISPTGELIYTFDNLAGFVDDRVWLPN